MPGTPAGSGRLPPRGGMPIFDAFSNPGIPRRPRPRAVRAVGDMTVQARFVQRETLTLLEHGLDPERILPNLTVPRLIEYALRREEGVVTDHGAFAAVTTPKTGRSPRDKFIVADPESQDRIWWEKNGRMEADAF